MFQCSHSPRGAGNRAKRGQELLTAWMLNAVGLFVTTVGALLLFVHLLEAPKFGDRLPDDKDKRAYRKHHLQVTLGVGLLSAWLVMHDVSIILAP